MDKRGKIKILITGVFLILLMGMIFVFAGSFNPEDEREIGYEFLDDSVHIWNTQDDYFFDIDSGIQFTNHYEDYWTRNIFCIGYYSGEEWIKINCADELTDFNKQIDSDNETYVNATLWKNVVLNIEGNNYDFRLAINYYLGLDDKTLSVTIYGKNIGIDIPFDLGFAWKVTDFEIPHEGAGGDSIFINNTNYDLDGNFDLFFKNMTKSQNILIYNNETNTSYEETIYSAIPFFRAYDYTKFLRLDWNENLNYAVKMYGDGNQENFYVALLVNAGTFNVGQEKSTTFQWIDAEGDHISNFSVSGYGTNNNGIATDGTNIWIIDQGTDLVYKYWTNGTYITSWNTVGQGTNNVGIVTDGTNIWTVCYVTKEVYKYYMNGSYTTEHWDTSGNGGATNTGIATDGTNIWIVDRDTRKVHKYDMVGNYDSNWSTAGQGGIEHAGGTTDGNYFWTVEDQQDDIHKWFMNGTHISSFDIGVFTTSCRGLAIYGSYIWTVDKAEFVVDKWEGPTPVDTTSPTITINTPLNQIYSTTTITFNVTAVDETAMGTCVYSLNSGITNYTMENSGDDYTHTNSSMAQGSHTANFYCNDTSNNINNSESVSFIIDTLPPNVIIVSPLSINYTDHLIDFNVTVTDSTSVDSCWYTLNDGIDNIKMDNDTASNFYHTNSSIAKGSYTAKFFCNDTSNNLNDTEQVSFTILNAPPTHTAPLLETQSKKNLSTEDLVCYNKSTSDPDGDEVINIYNWYKNSQSFLALNLAFENNTNDYSGNNNDGTNNGATFTDGKIGRALKFDGDDNITVSDSSTLDFTDKKTWQLWFKRTDTGAETLFDKGDGTHSNYKLEFLDNDKLKFSYSLEVGWQDDSEEFDLSDGTSNQTYYNTTHLAVMLNNTYTGDYTSKIFNDSEKLLSFNIITWDADVPAGGELSPEDGMVGLWHLNEASGTIEDSSGNNNDGTYNGVLYSQEGKINTAIGFDGTDDYVNFGNVLGFERTDTFSGAAWIKTSGTSEGILSKLSNTSPFPGWHFQLNANGKPALVLSNTWGTNMLSVTADVAVNDDAWHHVLFTYDGSSNNVGVKIYVDGESQNLTGDSTLSASILNSKDFQISGYDGTNSLFDGTIDEVVIYNKNLTETEVQEIYNKSIEAITNLSLSVRSCDDANCNGESWTEIEGESPQDLNLDNNTYFQFKAEFSTNDTDYSPKLYNVTLDYKKQTTEQEANITSISTITDNEWHLATITYNKTGENNFKLYLNGSLETEKTEYSVPQYLENDLIIVQGFNGSIDEFRIYQEALTLEQIQAHYNLDYNTIVSEETEGGDKWMCQVTPTDGEDDGDTLNSSELEVYWEIIFNVTSIEDDSSLTNFDISCNNSFSVSGVNSPYETRFLPGDWECTFIKITPPTHYDKIITFTANKDKIVNIGMSRQAYLTVEEHTWLEAIYNCLYSGDCSLYNLLLEINQTVSNIWEHTAPTDESVVLSEIVTNKVVDASNNLTIDYSVYVPIKAGYNLGAYLPIRIGYWFLDINNETCYNQGERPEGVEGPYCQPLIIETLGPMGGEVNFTVELQPSLPAGNYSIKRIIDIDPLGVWYNYGREVIGSFVMAETLSTYGASSVSESSSNSESSSSSSSSGGSGGTTTIIKEKEIIKIIQDSEEDKPLDEEVEDGIIHLNKPGITGGAIGTGLLSGGSFVIVVAILCGTFILFIIVRNRKVY